LKKVLIIEDEQYMAMILKAILVKTFNFDVEVVHSVKDGIEKMLNHFDLIITDIHLGDGTAHEMLPSLTESRKNGSKVILMSAYEKNTDKHRINSGEVDLFIEKPFTREKLIESLGELNLV